MTSAAIKIEQVDCRQEALFSQVLNLRNQLLRQPIGLDLFQEDLSQETCHITLAALVKIATTTPASSETGTEERMPSSSLLGEAKSDDNNAINSSRKEDIDSVLNRDGEVERVVGCIMLAPLEGEEDSFKVRQMAVSPDFQGTGLGSMLVTKAEEIAKQRGKRRLYVHGRKHAVGFYLKKGFTKLKDEEFTEMGIPHYALEKILT